MAASSSSSVPGASPHSFPLEVCSSSLSSCLSVCLFERGASSLCAQLSSAPEERGAWGSAGMLNHEETSDFCIVVAGGEAMFHVHSQLLRFHSLFFREMLREGVAVCSFPFLLLPLLLTPSLIALRSGVGGEGVPRAGKVRGGRARHGGPVALHL